MTDPVRINICGDFPFLKRQRPEGRAGSSSEVEGNQHVNVSYYINKMSLLTF